MFAYLNSPLLFISQVGLVDKSDLQIENISMEKEFRIKLGNRIKQIRQSKSLSREDVAFSCNFSGAYMGMIERAEYDFKISKLYKIAKALNVDIKDLFDF